MSDVFTASNGWTVEREAEELRTVSPDGYVRGISGQSKQALREYFQHKRDEELGLWRSPDHPDYVVRRLQDEPNGDRLVAVYCETSGTKFSVFENSTRYSVFDEIGLAYFAAHPVELEKPWLNAKPGEAWVITFSGGADLLAVPLRYMAGDAIEVRFSAGSMNYRIDDDRITAGRCVYQPGESEVQS